MEIEKYKKLNQKDKGVLIKFNEQVKKLENEKNFLRNLKCRTSSTQDNGMKVETDFPDGKTVKSFLLDFRPFILNNEEIYFLKICKKLLDKSDDINPTLRNKIVDARNTWLELLRGYHTGGMALNFNNKELTASKIIDLWLNGHFFHPTDSRKEKYKELNEMKISPFWEYAYMSFLDLIQRLSLLIIWLNKNVIKVLLNGKK